MKLEELHKVYFVGIGGIGMSAIARYFNKQGIEIHGYDKTETNLTKKLVEEGMQIHYHEDLTAIPNNIDLVVHTPAVPGDHVELQYFREHNFVLKKRAEVLGMISQSKKTIAVAGTHGKTTTTSILTHILKVGGVDCTAFLGGIAQNFESNYVEGNSDWVVVEADEYDRSFLHLSPNIAVVLSADPDHLDIYGDHESMLNSGFKAFAKKVEKDGLLLIKQVENQRILNFTDYEKTDFVQQSIEISSYGIGEGSNLSTNICVENGAFVFDYKNEEQTIENIRFTLPGKHNIENATAAITVALRLGVAPKNIKKALASFKGIKRRFELIYRDDQVTYIDDYAHHPSELNAAILAAKMLHPNKKITGIFQPHLYTRTQDFVDGFAKALDTLDEIILMDIYPARELPIEGVTSKLIFDKLKNKHKTLVTKASLMKHLNQQDNLEILLTLGAGDIDVFIESIKKMLENKNQKLLLGGG